MKIEKIKKISNSKYQIILENGEKINAYDEVLLRNNILYKKEITKEEIKKISETNGYYDCYSASIKYLTKSMHSKKEYFKFLNKYELNEKDKTKIVSELTDIGLLDDERFVKAFVYDKFNLNNYGPLKIKRELLEHNIDEKIIDIELAEIDKNEIMKKARKIIAKKLKTTKGSNYTIKQKINIYMNNLGYSKEYIDSYAFEDIDDSKQLENEYNKLYIKYSRKQLSEEELILKIKQKLYQKGYSLSRIEELIEKKRS